MRTARLVAFLGGAAVVVALAGCSSSEDAGTSSSAPAAAVSSPATEADAPETGTPPATEATTLDAPVADAPADALTMTCGQFDALEPAQQKAVAAAVIAGNRTKINPNNTELASTIAKSLCVHYPDRTVNSVLGGPE